jgi:hypothetical protein
MRPIQIHLAALENGEFRATGNHVLPITTTSIQGFRSSIHDAVAKALGNDDFKLEFSLSPDLEARFSRCPRCQGATRIEGDYVPAQYGNLDLQKKGMQQCSDCEGTGVTIPGF